MWIIVVRSIEKKGWGDRASECGCMKRILIRDRRMVTREQARKNVFLSFVIVFCCFDIFLLFMGKCVWHILCCFCFTSSSFRRFSSMSDKNLNKKKNVRDGVKRMKINKSVTGKCLYKSLTDERQNLLEFSGELERFAFPPFFLHNHAEFNGSINRFIYSTIKFVLPFHESIERQIGIPISVAIIRPFDTISMLMKHNKTARPTHAIGSPFYWQKSDERNGLAGWRDFHSGIRRNFWWVLWQSFIDKILLRF